MAVLKKIKFGNTSNAIQFTEVKPASGGVITATAAHTALTDENNPEYVIDLTIADDGTLVKENGALKVGTVPAAQVSVAAGGHDDQAAQPDGKTFVGDDVEEVLLELNDKINATGNVARTYTVVDDTANVQDLPTNVLKRYRLQETIGSQSPTLVGANIDIPKDSSLKEVYLGASTDTIDATTGVITKNTVTDPQSMNFAYQLADGTYSLTKIDVSKFLTESEFGDGLSVSGAGVVSANVGDGLEIDSTSKAIEVKIDSSSEEDSQTTPAAFLTVGANGIKIQGIKDEIDRKIDALNYSDTAVAGQYVSEVDEVEGVISVQRANVADAVLTGYDKGSSAPQSTAVAATDDVKGAIAKLEWQVAAAQDAAEQAAAAGHSKVEQATSTGTEHVTVTASQPDSDGAITYTIGENDIASDSDLDAEVTRAQAAEGEIAGLVGLTGTEGNLAWTPTTEYGGSTTSAQANMEALDAQVKENADDIAALETKVGAIEYEVNGTELIFYGIPLHSSQSPEPEPEP